MSFFSKLGEFGRGLVEGIPAGVETGLKVASTRNQEARLGAADAQRKREELRRDFAKLTSAYSRTAFVKRLEKTKDPSKSQLIRELKAQITEQQTTEKREVRETGQGLLNRVKEAEAITADRTIPTTPMGVHSRIAALEGAGVEGRAIQSGALGLMRTTEDLGLDTPDDLLESTVGYQRGGSIASTAKTKAEILRGTQDLVAKAVS